MEQKPPRLTYPGRPLQVGDLVMMSFLLDDTRYLKDVFVLYEEVCRVEVIELRQARGGDRWRKQDWSPAKTYVTVTRLFDGYVYRTHDIVNWTHISHQQSEQLRGTKLGIDLNIV